MAGTGHLEARQVKQRGAHYTPAELARFLAERAILQLDGRGGPIRVLDPACGDGSLLRAVWEVAPAALRRRLVLSGYDTDPVAAETARASLVGMDVTVGDFLEPVEAPPSADLVISNPPYVRTQVLGARRARELADRFALSGRVDLYHAFVRAIASALRPGGVLALLTSNRFMTILSGAAMRRLLMSEFHLAEVYDLGDTKIFGAAVLPAIVIGRKAAGGVADEPATFSRIYQTRRNGDPVKPFDHVLDALRRSYDGVACVGKSTYRITRGRLEPNGDPAAAWLLESDASRKWVRTVRSRTALNFGDVADIRVGIKTTADNVFIRDDWDDLPPELRPEDELLRPLLTHHVAQRWRLGGKPKMRVLYPHVSDESGRRVAIDLARFPRAAAYLRKHRRQLAGRKYVIESGRAWYEIWVPQQPRDWAKPKIVYPDIAESPTFFLDTSGAIVNGDCYWMTLRDEFENDDRWLYLLLAVANSSFIERFYDTVFHNKLYAGRRRFMTQYVRQFPLPAMDERIVAAARALVRGEDGNRPAIDEMVRAAFS